MPTVVVDTYRWFQADFSDGYTCLHPAILAGERYCSKTALRDGGRPCLSYPPPAPSAGCQERGKQDKPELQPASRVPQPAAKSEHPEKFRHQLKVFLPRRRCMASTWSCFVFETAKCGFAGTLILVIYSHKIMGCCRVCK